jgi:stage II sporulation protein D
MTLRRARFLGLVAATCALPLRVKAQDDVDPASNSARPALRVLLGAGDAEPASGGGFVFAGRAYRGSFQRLPSGEIVNLVDVEQYLYSVVPREMPPSWPASALQAQALCARTYVLQRSNPQRAYDLVPSEADQVYSGLSSETPAGRAAVDATAGQVVKFNNAYAQIAYSSCCGGHTESSSEAWSGGAVLPYLGGVPCTYCSSSPYYRWQTTITLDDVTRACGRRLDATGALQNLRVSSIDASGRARGFDLTCERGTVTIKGETFRLLVGSHVLRSLLVTSVRQAPSQPSLWFEGDGSGHGVGLCQWGARGLAQLGRSAADIIAWYFPGTSIGNV